MRTAAYTVACLIGAGMTEAAAVHAAPVAAATGAFQRGISDFGAGNFSQALDDFLEARRLGLDSPALQYDLGSTYYKLGRNDLAAAEFKSLLDDSKFGEFARYNLGLIAKRQGRGSEAQEYFATVAAQSDEAHLQSLARSQLPGASAAVTPWLGFVEASAGYDDNVALTSSSTLLTASGKGSAVISALAGGSGRISGEREHGLRVAGIFYDTQYPSQSDFNLLVARAGPEYLTPLLSWKLRMGLYASQIRLGNNELETLGELNLRGEHDIGSGRLRLDYRLERISGGTRYAYLSGWQNQFGVRGTWQSGSVKVSVGYKVALNQRRDLTVGTQFFSVSPTRHQVDADLRWDATSKATLFVDASYWRSSYHGTNLFLDGGVLVEQQRRDDGREAQFGAQYHLSSRWQISADFTHHLNDSNIARYQYTSNRYMLSAQYVF